MAAGRLRSTRLRHPRRLEKLVLLAPSATVLPPPIGLLVRAIAYYFIPLRFVTRNYLYWWGADAVRDIQTRSRIDEMIEELMLARRCFKRRKFVPPTVLTDRDWQKLNIPALFLVGENELNYSATKAVQRLAAVAPTVNTSVAANADHYLIVAKPRVGDRQNTELLERALKARLLLVFKPANQNDRRSGVFPHRETLRQPALMRIKVFRAPLR